MGKASGGKKVARAARAGRVRTRRRGGGSMVWPASLTAIVVLGTVLVLLSRGDRGEAADEPPTFSDHWHAAIGYYVCGSWMPDQPEFASPQGLHSHGDGLVHLHPTSSEVTGKGATLGKYLELADVEVTDDRLALPGQPERENGDRCDGERGEVKVELDGEVVDDFAGVRLVDGMRIAVAFVPEGDDIPEPPSAARLANPIDAPGGTTSVPPITAVPTATTGAPTPTTAAPTPTTAAPTATTGAPPPTTAAR